MICVGVLLFHVILKAPHLILLHMKSCIYHLAMPSCTIIAHCTSLFWLCSLYPCMCVCFFANRRRHRAVREGVPLHHPWRSRSCFLFRSDRRAHLLHLFYSFTLVVLLLSICCVLLCHVSFPHVTHMSRVTLPYPLPFVWCLSLASRSASLGYCRYLDMLSGYAGCLEVVTLLYLLLGSCFTWYIYWWR